MKNYEEKFEDILNFTKEENTLKENFFDISNINFSEDIISNWYAFFLDGDEEHHLGNLFLDSLLELINENDGYENFFMDGCQVLREFQTINKGFIDLVLFDGEEDNMQNSIIIENKINAKLNNDLVDYYESINVEDKKVGILLTLDKTNIDNVNYINITHLDWITRINKNIGNYWLDSDEKYLIYLKDFTQNIESISNQIEMNKNVEFYLKHSLKIDELVSFKKEAENFIADSLWNEIVDTEKFYWIRKNVATLSFGIKDRNYKFYVTHRHLFSEKYIEVELWIDNDEEVNSYTKKKKNKIESLFGKELNFSWHEQGERWLSITDKEYLNIDESTISEIGKHILELIEKDFIPLTNYLDELLN